MAASSTSLSPGPGDDVSSPRLVAPPSDYMINSSEFFNSLEREQTRRSSRDLFTSDDANVADANAAMRCSTSNYSMVPHHKKMSLSRFVVCFAIRNLLNPL